ncbi:MAG: hypothetical protein MK076_11645 [Flavobacteriales bacterium]|nr:hypothetical protein [Flavobacteriales bacterium]
MRKKINPKTKVIDLKTHKKAVRKVLPFRKPTANKPNPDGFTPPPAAA